MRRTLVSMAAALFTISLLVAVPDAGAASVGPDESQFVTLVNQARATAGLPGLIVDPELTEAARDWTEEMAAAGGISHAPDITEGITQYWLKVGENVGTGPSVNAVMEAFRASPGHNANIMDPAFTHVGVGVVWVGGSLFTTHRFMQLESATTPPPPTPTTTRPSSAPTPPTTSPAPTVPTTATPSGSTSTIPRPPAVVVTTTTVPGPAFVPETTTSIALPPPVIDPARIERLIEAMDASAR